MLMGSGSLTEATEHSEATALLHQDGKMQSGLDCFFWVMHRNLCLLHL